MSDVEIGGRPVHPIGIGTWPMGNEQTEADDARSVAAIQYSLSRGQNHIDTAEMYGSGRAETLVGRALQGARRSDVYIASKLWQQSCTRDAVGPAVEAMLDRLQTSYLDLLYIHADWRDLRLDETVAAMCDAVDRGLVRALGLSNFQLPSLRRAAELTHHPFVALQNRYSVIRTRDVPPELRAHCANHGIAVVAYQPIERGQVSGDPVVRRIAASHGATPAQIALAWLLAQDGVATIPKAAEPAHIDENLAATEIRLTEAETAELDAITAIA